MVEGNQVKRRQLAELEKRRTKVKEMGGKWHSEGKDSHWTVPK